MSLLRNIPILINSEEERRNKVVGEPDPTIAEQYRRYQVYRLSVVVDVLKLITIHDTPKHNDTPVKRSEPPRVTKLCHAEEGEANDDWKG